MKTTFCKCGNRLFFNNHSCLACGRSVGRCSVCRKLGSFSVNVNNVLTEEPLGSAPVTGAPSESPLPTAESFVCDQPGCGQEVAPCTNRNQAACTSFVSGRTDELCEWCQFTTLIPDLDQPANGLRWSVLELAKRRLLAELEQLGLPPYIGEMRAVYPLTFRFAAPTMVNGEFQSVITGHAEGVITINAEEADSDRREATRVALGEPQRTLIGHMRHEIGHYIDWSYVHQIARGPYIELFGDPMAMDYELAKQRHYTEGAPADWPTRFVSAYASMHPWEDFAETVNAYLDLMAIADTARDQKLCDIDTNPAAEIARVIQQTLPVAVAISEFNTDLGLPALLPEQLSAVAVEKLSFVHQLRRPELRAKFMEQLAGGSHSQIVGEDAQQPATIPAKPANSAPAQRQSKLVDHHP